MTKHYLDDLTLPFGLDPREVEARAEENTRPPPRLSPAESEQFENCVADLWRDHVFDACNELAIERRWRDEALADGQDGAQCEMMYEEDWWAARNSPFGITQAELDASSARDWEDIQRIEAEIAALTAADADAEQIRNLQWQIQGICKYPLGAFGENMDPDFWRREFDVAMLPWHLNPNQDPENEDVFDRERYGESTCCDPGADGAVYTGAS